MKHRLIFVIVAIASMLLQPLSSSLANHPTPYPDTITPGNNYSVNYTNNNPPPAVDANYFTTAQAQRIANALSTNNPATTGNPNGYHNGYVNLGFVAPTFNGTSPRNVNVDDCSQHGGCDSGSAPADRIRMPATGYLTAGEPCLRLVIGHELFHHVQFSYIGFNNWSAWGRAPVEGSARMMQDKIYSDLDANSGCITYQGEAANWLNNPDQNLWNSSYTFALFWNYLTEQLGSTSTEPQIGTNFIRRFWERAQTATNNGNIDFPGTLRATIAEFSTARTLEQIFQDFAIANYTKLMDVTALSNSSRYRYIDENEATGNVYANVTRNLDTTLDFSGVSRNVSVSMWGNEYYVVRPTGRCIDGKNNVVGFIADGDVMNWALVSTQGTESVKRIDRGTQGRFARALLQRTGSLYTELAAVAANTGNASASASIKFGCGEASVQILDPLASRPAYVGDKSAPDRFMVRVLATGPITLGTPSIEGLRTSDFEVYVGSVTTTNKATIVSGAHVQGEYWLVVQPPTKPAIASTKQNLVVTLGSSSDTEQEAVIYQKQILDQMLVIDKSNSMNYPSGAKKITAARNAARMFVSAARISDTIGIVSFNGNNSETNDDATLDMALITVTASSQTTARNKINGIAASGWTSIGDGVDKARPQFAASGGPGEDWIVLLSDGMENEAKYWASVSSAITTAGIRVNTIALGPATDQALLQQIANQTGGIYYYVDSSTYAAAARADGADSVESTDAVLNATSNALADAYALANERQRRHQRVGEWSGTVNGSVYSTTFTVDGGSLIDGLFTLNWPDSTGVLTITLRRPNGTLVQHGVSGVQFTNQGTHIVVSIPNMAGGAWTLNVSGGTGAVPFVAFLSGIPKNGVETRLWLGQTPLQVGPLRGLYLRGLPMPILASLSDSAGPIQRAKVMATVRHPGGMITKLPLFDDGNHNDGNASDGVFGNLYALTTVSSPRAGSDFLTPTITTTVQNGSYLVELQVDGQDSAGAAFQRKAKTAFQIYELVDRDKEYMQSAPVDTDQDGMPDRYERLHSCLNPSVVEPANHDPDRDGLTSKDEWGKHGTDPCDSDTDAGGDSDGSDMGGSRNPFDPSDDKLTRPIDPEVINWVADHLPNPPAASNANLIRYPANANYRSIRMYRTDSVNPSVFTTIVFSATQYRGIYTDTGLVNNRTYTYVLQGIGDSGVGSALSPVFVGVPKVDPLPPRGGVIIAGGKSRIGASVTRVTLESDPDVSEYMLSNSPTFFAASWRPFTKTAPYSLTVNVTHTLAAFTGLKTVYARFRDAAGNVSATYSDDVVVMAPTSFGVIRGVATLLRPAARAEAGAEAGESTEFDSVASVEEGLLEPAPEMFIAEEPASEPASDALVVEESAPMPEPMPEPATVPEESAPLAVMPEVAPPQADAHDHADDAAGSHEHEPAVAQRESASAVRSPAGTFVWCANIPDAIPTLATADGKFELTDVPPGRCLLRVLQEGFRPRSMFVDITAGKVVTVSNKVELSPRGSGLPSSDALLRSLSLSSSVFGRTFVSTTFNYTATNSSTALALKVVATAHPSATMLYESSAGTCISNECPLTSSRTILTVTVAADDGITDRRYIVVVQKVVVAPTATKLSSISVVDDQTATETPLAETATPTPDGTVTLTETPLPPLTQTITATPSLSETATIGVLSPALTPTLAPPPLLIYLPFLQR